MGGFRLKTLYGRMEIEIGSDEIRCDLMGLDGM